MSNPSSVMLWSEKQQGAQPEVLEIVLPITAAKTVTQLPGTLTVFDAIASQSVIDTFLGTSSEFAVAAFDATAMGTDAVGILVDMSGQSKSVVKMDVVLYSAAGAIVAEAHVLKAAALTASSLTTQLANGSQGNQALRVILTGVDAATSGHIHVSIYWKSK